MSVDANLSVNSGYFSPDSLAQNAKLHHDAITAADEVVFVAGVAVPSETAKRVAVSITDTLKARHGNPDLRAVSYTLAQVDDRPSLLHNHRTSYMIFDSGALVYPHAQKLHLRDDRPIAMTGVATPMPRDFFGMVWDTPTVIAETSIEGLSPASIALEMLLHGHTFVSAGIRASRINSVAYASAAQEAGVPMDLIVQIGDRYFPHSERSLLAAAALGVNVYEVEGQHNRVINDPYGVMDAYTYGKSIVMHKAA